MLRALLADAVLQARARANEAQAEPLAILAASAVSEKMAQELREYMREFGDGIAWGILDQKERFELHGPDLDSIRERPRDRKSAEGQAPQWARGRSPYNPLSDLGQWMLKVLISPNVPDEWMRAPRERVRGVSELSRRAEVSLSSASNFLSSLEGAGYIELNEDGVRVVRVEALLEAWRVASRPPLEERYAKFIIPASDSAARIRKSLKRHALRWDNASESSSCAGPRGERACLALFAACDQLGVKFVRGAPIHVYSESLASEFLEQLELRLVGHRAEADILIRQPRFPESVFRGCVLVDAVPSSDIVQCWLDVSFHPARGAEQAEEIHRRLRMEGWSR